MYLVLLLSFLIFMLADSGCNYNYNCFSYYYLVLEIIQMIIFIISFD